MANLNTSVPQGNILLTSASQKAPLIIALRKAAHRIAPTIKVIAGDTDIHAPAQHVAQGFWHMPKLEMTTTSEMIEACNCRDIRVVLPTRDGELLWWSERKAQCDEAGIKILVSSPDAVERCLDKLAFARFATKLGLPVIASACHIDDLDRGIKRFVVKERFGAGSKSVGINLDTNEANRHAAQLFSPLFQPYVGGTEISIDAWCDAAGAVCGVVLRNRDRVVRGESQITTTFRDRHLEEMASVFIGHMNLCGPVVMQAFVKEDQTLSVIEVNARFGGASTASINVGLDSLYWSLEAAFVNHSKTPVFRRTDGEIRQIRLPKDIFLHDSDI